MERELSDNNKALENADKGFDEAADGAKDFSKDVKSAGDTADSADGKFFKLGDTAKKVGAALGTAATAIGTVAVAAGKKLWDMANDTASAGDAIDKTSQKIGISAESYQKWDYVFERCGADVDNLQSGMKKLSTVITDAAGGSDSAAEKLSAVGLSIEDLNGKSQDEQLQLVITALQGMEGLWQGISDAGAWLWDKISGFFGGIVNGIKSFFGIHSPSTLFAGLGDNMAKGLGIGFGDEMKKVSEDMQNAIPSDFDVNADCNVNGIIGLNSQAIDVTIPLTIDGVTLTKVVSRIQWSNGQVTMRNAGAV